MRTDAKILSYEWVRAKLSRSPASSSSQLSRWSNGHQDDVGKALEAGTRSRLDVLRVEAPPPTKSPSARTPAAALETTRLRTTMHAGRPAASSSRRPRLRHRRTRGRGPRRLRRVTRPRSPGRRGRARTARRSRTGLEMVDFVDGPRGQVRYQVSVRPALRVFTICFSPSHQDTSARKKSMSPCKDSEK